MASNGLVTIPSMCSSPCMTFSYPLHDSKFDLNPENRVKISISIVFAVLGFEEMEYGHQNIAKGILKAYGYCQWT